MKKMLTIVLAGMMGLSLAACRANKEQESSQPEVSYNTEQVSELEALPVPSSEVPEAEDADINMLVTYFSYAENTDLPEGVDASATASIQIWNDDLTGNTGVVANMIAETAGADLFSIQTVEKYPDSYDATIDRGQKERNADARPELVRLPENLEQYDVIFLGFPNWWGDMPMALYSFLDEVDLTGKTIVPFVTSGGSGFSDTINTIESLESGAIVQDGLSISGASVTEAQDQVSEWLSGLGYAG